jgi:hypothetical protein
MYQLVGVLAGLFMEMAVLELVVILAAEVLVVIMVDLVPAALKAVGAAVLAVLVLHMVVAGAAQVLLMVVAGAEVLVPLVKQHILVVVDKTV